MKWIPYVGILALGLVLGSFLEYKHQEDINIIRENYISERRLETEAIATKVEDVFKDLYQGLRTIALLPGVRNIDRYGKNFHLDSKNAMQQIYNNTYLNITLSEVYLLAKELNPETIDPNTKNPEEPILTFDEFITGDSNKEDKNEDKPSLEEVEIFEYRLMNKQLSYLRSTFPNKSSFKDLNVPAVMGEPVVTCDNSEFTQADLDSGNDKPRLGMVYTLPVYDDAGDFHGAVSGVVRLNVLEKLIPKGNFALVSQGNKYRGITSPTAAFDASIDSFSLGKTNKDLIYSQIRALTITDSSPWEIWAIAPNDEFINLPSVKQANLIFYSGIVVTCLMMIGLGIGVRVSQQSQLKLEMKVKEKTKELSARNNDMRLILDNAEEGFLTCSLDGHIGEEYSAIVEKWLGKPTSSTKIWDLLMVGDQKRMGIFKVGWSQFVDDFLPFDVCAGQMPAVIQNGNFYFGLTFTPIKDHNKKLSSILVVVKNVTAEVESERKDRQQRELVATFQALSKDRAGFLEYFSDAENMVKSLVESKGKMSKESQFRLVHTLKGNSAQYELASIAEVCHVLESKLQEGTEPLPISDIETISNSWNETSARIINLIGNRVRRNIELDVSEYTYVLQRIKSGASHSEIGAYIERWRLEPAIKRLDRLVDKAKSLADRLNVENINFTTDDNGIRLEPDAFSDVWSSLIHVIRNSIDHGFGNEEIANPSLDFSISMSGDSLQLSVKDNGAGINWEKVREKAKNMNLPCVTQGDLEACLFADGLSTRDEVTSVSGRGVGMAAVKAAVYECGGTIAVVSQKGQGTEFIFTLPMQQQLKDGKSKIAA